MSVQLIGIAGLTFIVLAWVVGIKSVPPLELTALYGVGSFLLTVYAVLCGDLIFTVLNALATGLACLNAYRALSLRRSSRGVSANRP